MTNAAVVGYGYAGRVFHSYLIERAEGLDLYAISTRSAEGQRLAREEHPRARIYGSMDELLGDGRVELVVIATPHHTHRELAIRAMDAGRHVVVDKIMCMDAEEASDMIAARDRNGVLLSVFHNRRWDWDYLTVKKVIADGLIGEPYLLEAGILSYRPPRGWRADQRQSGGILYDWPAHFVDQALQLVPGPVYSVFCEVMRRDRWNTDIANYAKLLIRFVNGVLCQIEIGNLAAIGKPRWYILGTLGGLVKHGLDPQEAALRSGDIDLAEEDPAERARVVSFLDGTAHDRLVDSVRGSWLSYYRNIAEVLNEGAELMVTPEQIYRVMLVFDAAVESAGSGEIVRLSQDGA
ncbi:MAG TPA: Gfo/Idh/MocA family oxidoreductase [Anaerolineae bacterium]|nr:Gfo/Idh/MocA family oxidoreductase [Anaerolineae bacterium]